MTIPKEHTKRKRCSYCNELFDTNIGFISIQGHNILENGVIKKGRFCTPYCAVMWLKPNVPEHMATIEDKQNLSHSEDRGE